MQLAEGMRGINLLSLLHYAVSTWIGSKLVPKAILGFKSYFFIQFAKRWSQYVRMLEYLRAWLLTLLATRRPRLIANIMYSKSNEKHRAIVEQYNC